MARLRSRDLFPTDEPLRAEALIGRQHDVTNLVAALRNGEHRIVAGPRRTGKTSVCKAVLQKLRARGTYVVAVDLFALANAGEFATALAAATLENRPAARKALAAARRSGTTLLRGVHLTAKSAVMAEFGTEIDIAFSPSAATRDPEGYLRWSFDLLERVATADDRQLVLYLDEFQEIAAPGTPYGDPDRLTKAMRASLQHSPHVTCLFSGSIEHLMRDLFVPHQRAFYKFGGFHALGQITAEEWWSGIEAQFTRDDVTCDPAALQRLVELGEGHPRSTMLIAQQTHTVSVMTDVRHIDLGTVLSGFAQALEADRASHEVLFDRVRALRKHTVEVLRAVAAGAAPYNAIADRRAVTRALASLRDVGVIEQPAGARGDWRVVDPLFRYYLSRQL